ncbi:MAG TPA: lysylphosphatidylglycerol synthase transmembrane domain-containing protein, partial [Dehalococcoidia bacterium]|nr:lysylphosphatidylglycerol synthase transmembrane domain-containing protein [Dehalococcoidia bacterium]
MAHLGAGNVGAPERVGLRGRHVALVVLLGVVVFGTLFVYGDLPDLFRSLGQFPLSYLAIVLALALTNYLIRWVRWHYYLRTLDVDLEGSHNVLIFFSGLSMAISPGKVGELAKCYLLSEADQVPVSRSSPAVIMERVTDIVAVFTL